MHAVQFVAIYEHVRHDTSQFTQVLVRVYKNFVLTQDKQLVDKPPEQVTQFELHTVHTPVPVFA